MTTVQKIKDYLVESFAQPSDAVIADYISVVTAYIERYTGRTFTPAVTPGTQATERFYDGNGSSELFIDDAAEVTQVKDGNTIIPVSDFRLYPSNRLPKTRIILPFKKFTWGAQNITVTAKWGYGASVPKDLEFAATVMVAGIINHQNSDEKDVQSETIGRYSVTYKSNSPQEHDFSNTKKILKMYRKLV